MTIKKGPYHTKDPLTAFLYELTRDCVTPGKINSIIDGQVCESLTDGWVLTDWEISKLAARWAAQLRDQARPLTEDKE